jgi:hypothetical protein
LISFHFILFVYIDNDEIENEDLKNNLNNLNNQNNQNNLYDENNKTTQKIKRFRKSGRWTEEEVKYKYHKKIWIYSTKKKI